MGANQNTLKHLGWAGYSQDLCVSYRLSGFCLCLSLWPDWSSSMVCPELICWDEPLPRPLSSFSASSSRELSESSSEEDDNALCCGKRGHSGTHAGEAAASRLWRRSV